VVNVLAAGPKDCGFEPGQSDGFLRVLRIRSTSPKPEVRCCRVLRRVKDLLKSHGDE
jgi:hypothetical protein